MQCQRTCEPVCISVPQSIL